MKRLLYLLAPIFILAVSLAVSLPQHTYEYTIANVTSFEYVLHSFYPFTKYIVKIKQPSIGGKPILTNIYIYRIYNNGTLSLTCNLTISPKRNFTIMDQVFYYDIQSDMLVIPIANMKNHTMSLFYINPKSCSVVYSLNMPVHVEFPDFYNPANILNTTLFYKPILLQNTSIVENTTVFLIFPYYVGPSITNVTIYGAIVYGTPPHHSVKYFRIIHNISPPYNLATDLFFVIAETYNIVATQNSIDILGLGTSRSRKVKFYLFEIKLSDLYTDPTNSLPYFTKFKLTEYEIDLINGTVTKLTSMNINLTDERLYIYFTLVLKDKYNVYRFLSVYPITLPSDLGNVSIVTPFTYLYREDNTMYYAITTATATYYIQLQENFAEPLNIRYCYAFGGYYYPFHIICYNFNKELYYVYTWNLENLSLLNTVYMQPSFSIFGSVYKDTIHDILIDNLYYSGSALFESEITKLTGNLTIITPNGTIKTINLTVQNITNYRWLDIKRMLLPYITYPITLYNINIPLKNTTIKILYNVTFNYNNKSKYLAYITVIKIPKNYTIKFNGTHIYGTIGIDNSYINILYDKAKITHYIFDKSLMLEILKPNGVSVWYKFLYLNQNNNFVVDDLPEEVIRNPRNYTLSYYVFYVTPYVRFRLGGTDPLAPNRPPIIRNVYFEVYPNNTWAWSWYNVSEYRPGFDHKDIVVYKDLGAQYFKLIIDSYDPDNDTLLYSYYLRQLGTWDLIDAVEYVTNNTYVINIQNLTYGKYYISYKVFDGRDYVVNSTQNIIIATVPPAIIDENISITPLDETHYLINWTVIYNASVNMFIGISAEVYNASDNKLLYETNNFTIVNPYNITTGTFNVTELHGKRTLTLVIPLKEPGTYVIELRRFLQDYATIYTRATNVTITITQNKPPVIKNVQLLNTIYDISENEYWIYKDINKTLRVIINATDPNNDPLTYYIYLKNKTTYVKNITTASPIVNVPVEDIKVGKYIMEVIVSDPYNAIDNKTFTLIVTRTPEVYMFITPKKISISEPKNITISIKVKGVVYYGPANITIYYNTTPICQFTILGYGEKIINYTIKAEPNKKYIFKAVIRDKYMYNQTSEVLTVRYYVPPSAPPTIIGVSTTESKISNVTKPTKPTYLFIPAEITILGVTIPIWVIILLCIGFIILFLLLRKS